MNFEMAKSIRLQRWHTTIADNDFRMQNPEGHRETLLEMAATLLREGLINPLERFDLKEMADAAYWHAVEELQHSPDHYRGASTYNVVQLDNGKLLGTIRRSIFNYASDAPRGASFSYDGKVYTDSEGARLTMCLTQKIGTITGLILQLSGRKYRLIETERMIEGVTHHPLSDGDTYRLFIDDDQIAQEARDLRVFQRVRPHIESAVFCICPTCLERFGDRDDCQNCAGKGFLTRTFPPVQR
ncbi:hypothetical protein [Pseudomonas sp. 18058]|uniref:hypothetical protein n=1 Tax=Pseudomonas sp. 18058 TaxID=2681406 RepID=UPI00135C9227|nr:hypothetical protein [Pseudomonas sp. 18058]